MKIGLINSADQADKTYVRPIEILLFAEGYKVNTCHWEGFNFETDRDQLSGIIISASPKGNNDNFKRRMEAFGWLKECELPVIGICAGHQLINCVFGATLIKNRESEEGTVQVRILKDDPVFRGMGPQLEVEQHHLDSVSLTKDFALLASSERCRVQAVRHISKPFVSVQWHAETSSPGIILNWIKELDKN